VLQRLLNFNIQTKQALSWNENNLISKKRMK
jgi:hypothetical protein